MDINWTDLASALALVLVLEGLLPFVSPNQAKLVYARASALDHRSVRMLGFFSMLAGVVFLSLV